MTNFYEQLGKKALGSRLRQISEMMTNDATEIYVLYGTDFPHNISDMTGALARIDQLAPADRDNVRGANAQRVFKL